MDHLRAEVERLDAEIEEIGTAMERCRKIDLAARVLGFAGFAWLVTLLAGLIRGDILALLLALSATLVGLVLYGSNRSTFQEKAAALADREERRREIIGRMRLEVIQGRSDG